MADVLKGGNLLTAAVIGIGASFLGPVVLPALRPMAKSLIKGGLIAFDQGRTAWAELNERAGDMIAEVREEMEGAPAQPQAAGMAAAAPAAPKPKRATQKRAVRKPSEPRPH